jgi:hypothetical protein
MFHRNVPRHAAGRPSIPPLPAGFMQQRPYAEIVLGRAPFRVGDVVCVNSSYPHPVHVDRVGTVVGLSGAHKLILVEFEVGIVYFEVPQLDLVHTAPTVVMPVVEDEPATVPISVVRVPGGAIGSWPDPDTVLDAIHTYWGTGLAPSENTVVMDAAELMGDFKIGDEVRSTTFGELYDDAVGIIEQIVPTKRELPIGVRTTACITARATGDESGIVWFDARELAPIPAMDGAR